MKNRLISAFLAVLMLFVALPTVHAAEFSDIENHWAGQYINEATELGLFSGITDTEFGPQLTMTRAMFVTVLGRIEGIDREFWSSDAAPDFFEDVPDQRYYTPYVRWGVCNGIVSGLSATEFAPDEPITREQMARLIATYIIKMYYGLLPADSTSAIPEQFSDVDKIAGWAAESVDFLRAAGILSGSPDGNGGMQFLPQDTATRAECATVFCVLQRALVKSEQPTQQPTSIALSDSSVELSVGQQHALLVTIHPEVGCNLFWKSSDERVVTVDQTGHVSAVGRGSAVITVYTGNGLSASCAFTCTEDLASANESYSEKCVRLFGKVVEDPRLYYSDRAVAVADMKQLTVPVWDFDAKGNKVTKYMTFSVHHKLASTVTAIFTEIYNGSERFPIHYLGGWNWAGKSEHTIGTALDLNPDENYYCAPDGTAIVGNYWKPGENPYSIALDGEVAQIFAKYGFRQGAYWNSGYRDYMHFSYFGT